MTNDKEYTERRGSLIILTITIILVIIIVAIGICTIFLLEKSEANIILYVLIGLLLIVAVLSFIFLEVQRREAQRKKDRGAAELVRQIYEQQRHQEPIVEMRNGENGSATWALTKPWRYSQRSTLRI